ncbi:hypothetical protein BaRGS_00033242, partial [Batillaria attramentaria]
YRDHECIRPCREDTEPKVCRYRWVLENYLTLSRACYRCPSNQSDCLRPQCVSGDGVSRSIRTANRILPGPGIQVCEGDMIEVEVENQMTLSEGVTIHWHGLHQSRFPHMDGVAMVTQCPIPAFSSFTYRFAAEDVAGTHWWHSHAGLYRGDGLFGPIVIRQTPSRDPHHALYDLDLPEHVIVVNDWPHQPVMDMFAGRGVYQPSRTVKDDDPVTPFAEFHVQPDTRYRFRLINSGSFRCPISLSVENHDLLIIASDARPLEPFKVKAFVSFSGERYDFVLHTKKAPKHGGRYWIEALGLTDCYRSGAKQLAVLRYSGDADKMADPPLESANYTEHENEPSFNMWLVDKEVPGEDSQIAKMTSLEPDDDSLLRDPDQQFFVEFAYRLRDNVHYHDADLYPVRGKGYSSMSSAMINNISNILPTSPVLTQHKDLDPGQVVELVIYNANTAHGFTHPLHLHGHSFRVVAVDRLDVPMTRDLFIDLDRKGQIKRNLHKAPYKDTLPIPDGGYVVLRIKADNPGAWFMHCHVAFHAEIGMALTLQVNPTEGQLPPPPPDFPRCGVWPPTSDVTSGKCENEVNMLKQDQGDDAAGSVAPAVVVVAPVMMVVVAVVLTLVVYRRQRKAEQRRASQQRILGNDGSVLRICEPAGCRNDEDRYASVSGNHDGRLSSDDEESPLLSA